MTSAAEIAKGLGARRSGPHQWQGRCPSHKDRTPSLSITDGDDGRPLVHCHAGCEQSAVIEALRAKGLWGSNSNSGVSRMLRTAETIDHGTIILPIPDCAPPPPKAHPKFGEPTANVGIRPTTVARNSMCGDSTPREEKGDKAANLLDDRLAFSRHSRTATALWPRQACGESECSRGCGRGRESSRRRVPNFS